MKITDYPFYWQLILMPYFYILAILKLLAFIPIFIISKINTYLDKIS